MKFLGLDKKQEEKVKELETAHLTILDKLDNAKDKSDFNNFIDGENIPPEVAYHFRGYLLEWTYLKRYKIPSMRRSKENECIRKIKMDLRRIADHWEPTPNLVTFTLLHELEMLLSHYTGVEESFSKKYVEWKGRENGITRERIKEEIGKIKEGIMIKSELSHERAFSGDVIKKFKGVMSALSSAAIKLIVHNDSFIDYDKLDNYMNEELKKKSFSYALLEKDQSYFDEMAGHGDWLKDEYLFFKELKVREIYLNAVFVNLTHLEPTVSRYVKSTLTKLNKLLEYQKGLVIGG